MTTGEAPPSDPPASDPPDRCGPHEHLQRPAPVRRPEAVERAVRLFRALGDEARLRTLDLLVPGEACVSELAEATGERVSTMSHRLRLLRVEGLVTRRRDGRHIYYMLTDRHVLELIENALQHAAEDHDAASHRDDED